MSSSDSGLSLEAVQAGPWKLFECISGSHAYGTSLPGSDEDRKGVFVLPRERFYGLSPTDHVANPSNDVVFYELGRFVDLLSHNNPNLLEMLASPPDCVVYRHPLFERLQPELFLSRLCKETFAGYAVAQIKKARGLNKKILNPVARERKTVLHFCYVLHEKGSLPLLEWLEREGRVQERCGLVNVEHMKDVYALYYDEQGSHGLRGVMQKEIAAELLLSSVPKELRPLTHLYFNRDGFSKYCKDYTDYWHWVEKRNELRYQGTLEHGKNYDAKNMMHTFRLLDMAEEILREGCIRVRRPNREELLEIRSGRFRYEDLLARAEERLQAVQEACVGSPLPERPDLTRIEHVLVGLRIDWYAAGEREGPGENSF